MNGWRYFVKNHTRIGEIVCRALKSLLSVTAGGAFVGPGVTAAAPFDLIEVAGQFSYAFRGSGVADHQLTSEVAYPLPYCLLFEGFHGMYIAKGQGGAEGA